VRQLSNYYLILWGPYSMSQKKKVTITLRAGETIGSMAAEDDHNFLEQCFVENPIIDQLKDNTSSRCVLIGRTGSGKSAILWKLEEELSNVSRIIPKEASFNFVANSTIIQYLTQEGVDLEIFYEYLWKHILCIHIIKECLNVKTDDKFKNLINRFEQSSLFDQSYSKVLSYLRENEKTFWNDMEELCSSETKKFSNNITSGLGTSNALVEAQIRSGNNLSEELKVELVQRGRDVINKLQMQKLTQTIEALSKLLEKKKTQYFILIDDLEDNWGGEKVQNQLILSLLECNKTFRKIKSLKIIIAIREDIFEVAMNSNTHRTFQPEKYESKLARIKWSPALLKRIIDRRLNHLFKNKYEKKGIGIEQVLPKKIKNEPINNYLTNRTLYRPRDIITFFNAAFEHSGEHLSLPLSVRQIQAAEKSYANERLKTLCNEWKSVHPSLRTFIEVLQNSWDGMKITDFNEERLMNLIISLCEKEAEDKIEELAQKYFNQGNEQTFQELVASLICCLYKVGIIGIKFGPKEPILYFHEVNNITIDPLQITEETKFYLQPMLRTILHRQEIEPNYAQS
jgi:hypothetical protein